MATNTGATGNRTRNPLYASVGMGDFAVAKLRELPAELQKLPAELQKLPAELQKLPAELQKLPAAMGDPVKVLREQASTLSSRANDLYTGLAVRGEKVVGAVRRQPASQAAKSHTKRGATSAQKAAKATARAAEQATDQLG